MLLELLRSALLSLAWVMHLPAAPKAVAEGAVAQDPAEPFRAPLPDRAKLARSPANRYANLSPHSCRAEIKKRKLAVVPAGRAAGVASPLRFSGPFHGVTFVAPGKKSVYGVFDCRLALVLDDLALRLSRQGIAKVYVDNLYRPRARLPGRKHKKSQHAYGLAIDILAFELASGKKIGVEEHWKGERGTTPCGPDACITELDDESELLRTLYCDMARQGLFHHLLSPSYDAAHRNHLHLDVKRGSTELLVR